MSDVYITFFIEYLPMYLISLLSLGNRDESNPYASNLLLAHQQLREAAEQHYQVDSPGQTFSLCPWELGIILGHAINDNL